MNEETPQAHQTEADIILAQEQAGIEQQITSEQRLEQVEQLWNDPNIHSFSLRRHSN